MTSGIVKIFFNNYNKNMVIKGYFFVCIVVHNGSEAMSVFATLHNKSKEEQEIIRRGLLAYCKLDTFAMVKIWEKLIEVI